jgi:hypothetical protein
LDLEYPGNNQLDLPTEVYVLILKRFPDSQSVCNQAVQETTDHLKFDNAEANMKMDYYVK